MSKAESSQFYASVRFRQPQIGIVRPQPSLTVLVPLTRLSYLRHYDFQN